MKKVQSTVQPNQYWIRKTDDKQHYIKLRKNIEELTRVEEDETTSIYYQYDELEITVPKRSDIEEYLANNFEALFVAHCPEKAYEKIQLLEQDNADLWYEVMTGGV